MPHFSHGNLEGAFHMLRLPGTLRIVREYKWQALLRSWQRLTGQQDAAEFLGHLLLQSQPGAPHGYWAAKLIVGPSNCRRLDVVDRGHLASPIVLDATAGDLSSGLQAWQQQYSIHALQEPSSFLIIQLRRFAQNGREYTKIQNEAFRLGNWWMCPFSQMACGSLVLIIVFRPCSITSAPPLTQATIGRP